MAVDTTFSHDTTLRLGNSILQRQTHVCAWMQPDGRNLRVKPADAARANVAAKPARDCIHTMQRAAYSTPPTRSRCNLAAGTGCHGDTWYNT